VTLARCGSQPCSFAGAGKLKGVSKRGGKWQGRLERLGRTGPGEGLYEEGYPQYKMKHYFRPYNPTMKLIAYTSQYKRRVSKRWGLCRLS